MYTYTLNLINNQSVQIAAPNMIAALDETSLQQQPEIANLITSNRVDNVYDAIDSVIAPGGEFFKHSHTPGGEFFKHSHALKSFILIV